ncbi:FUSC family protein [Streptomyces sp. NPDC086182]|uniref:FUSC family protein n=1 Tax=Streptomyces sp. NPDC086182 TaxID=3155058 RepID=UPI00343FAE21
MDRLARVFAVDRKGFSVPGAVGAAGVLLVTLIAIDQLNQQKYFLSVVMAVLFVALSDPGGGYPDRALRMTVFALFGAALTALGFYVGGHAWGYMVLALFVVTLLSGLAVRFGRHTFAAGLLLNVWFIITLVLPASYSQAHIPTKGWQQALAWLVGAGAWLAFTCIVWLASRRAWRPRAVMEIPGDTGGPVELTRPVVFYALIRALAVAGSGAIAFGLHEPNASWLPLATLIAMKPDLAQSKLVAVQRLLGAALGAVVAVPVLLAVDNDDALKAIVIVLAALAASLHGVNYLYYCAAVACGVLIAMDVPNPTNYASEGRRVLFTFIGVAIGVVVMFLADLLQKHNATPTTPPGQTPGSAAS